MARYILVVDTDTESFGCLDDVAMSADMRLGMPLGIDGFSWVNVCTTAYADMDDLLADYTAGEGCFDFGPPEPLDT